MKKVLLVLSLLAALTVGCTLPGEGPGAAPTEYLLNAEFDPAGISEPDGPVILVVRPRAAVGFDSPRMIYVERPHELESFARNRWAGPPAAMIEPLLVDALQATGAFAAVIDGGSGLGGDLRLDTEITHLFQDFARSPSRVWFGVRATLVDAGNGRVLFARNFETEEPAHSDNPRGGAEAANRAVQRVLKEIADAAASRAAAATPGG